MAIRSRITSFHLALPTIVLIIVLLLNFHALLNLSMLTSIVPTHFSTNSSIAGENLGKTHENVKKGAPESTTPVDCAHEASPLFLGRFIDGKSLCPNRGWDYNTKIALGLIKENGLLMEILLDQAQVSYTHSSPFASNFAKEGTSQFCLVGQQVHVGSLKEVIKYSRKRFRKGAEQTCAHMAEATQYTKLEPSEVKLLCRGLEVDESGGCRIFCRSENRHFQLNKSSWFPAALLSTVKHLDAETWKKKVEELSNKSPGKVEIMNEEDTNRLDMGQAFPRDNSRFEAGFTMPTGFLVVVRPRRGTGPTHKQGMIVTEPLHIMLTVTHCTCLSPCWKRRASGSSGKASPPNDKDDHGRLMCTFNAQSTVSKSGVKGLYMFSMGSSEASRLVTQGIYTFHISVEGEKYKDLEHVVSIQIVPSRVTLKWTLCTHKEDCMISDHNNFQQLATAIRLNERLQEDLFVQKYDQYDNRQMFEKHPDLEVMVLTARGESLEMRSKIQANFGKGSQGGRHRLQIKSLLFRSGSLQLLELTFEGVLRACFQHDQYANIKCKVFSGSLASIHFKDNKPLIPKGYVLFQEALQPGKIIKQLTLQGLDACGNKIEKGQKMQVHLEGLEFQDQNGRDREVDDHGCLQLGGLLKVTCHYNSAGSISLMSSYGIKLCTITFQTVTRRLIATQVPRKSYVGRQLEGVRVEIVDECGRVDTDVDGYIHSITLDWIKGVTCPFTKGECTLPNFKLPEKPGPWEGKVYFSANRSLSVTVAVELELATACSLGPARRKTEILTANCGVPLVVPFSVYDAQHQRALLSKSMKDKIKPKYVAKDPGDVTFGRH